MLFWVLILLIGWVIGFIVVAANPSPYFAALGLVFVVGTGGVLLLLSGGSYFCFVLTLVYLGGMLVVFAYTAAIAADPFPETFGSAGVLSVIAIYCLGCFVGGLFFWGGQKGISGDLIYKGDVLEILREDVEGVASIYEAGGWSLLLCAWGLLLSLFVVIEIIRGPSRGTLRAVRLK